MIHRRRFLRTIVNFHGLPCWGSSALLKGRILLSTTKFKSTKSCTVHSSYRNIVGTGIPYSYRLFILIHRPE